MSTPFFDPQLGVNALGEVSRYQWFVETTPVVDVNPVSYRALCNVLGEEINLRGRSGKYIPPDAANALLRRMTVLKCPPRIRVRDILKPVIGRADLPDPRNMTLDDWRAMPSSLLRIEREVERFVVEPLLRFCNLADWRASWVRQHRVGRRAADYVVLAGAQPCSVIEVKQRVKAPRGRLQDWARSPDYVQLSDYGSRLGCASALIDCDEIFLFSPRPARLLRRLERRTLTAQQLGLVAGHLGGGLSLKP